MLSPLLPRNNTNQQTHTLPATCCCNGYSCFESVYLIVCLLCSSKMIETLMPSSRFCYLLSAIYQHLILIESHQIFLCFHLYWWPLGLKIVYGIFIAVICGIITTVTGIYHNRLWWFYLAHLWKFIVVVCGILSCIGSLRSPTNQFNVKNILTILTWVKKQSVDEKIL